MASANITVRTESELKTKAQNVLNGLGIDMPTAINSYLRQIVNENGIPFELKAEKPQSLPKLGGWEGDIWMA
ncbi:MAG: type II toxin-antitoxin system RelB/DinJ family antitoxin, partial [Clostridiales bacterium]|nr:type II toxin-antitoxin system RelB/DinJ family antitoxin [Clostridiales bacterium]